MTVYIVTRDRPGNLKKIVPRWIAIGLPVTLVVEDSEYEAHKSLVRGMGWDNDVLVISPASPNRGVGHARRFAVRHARDAGLTSMIMSDDDLMPSGSSARDLLHEAAKPGVLGIGATRPLHDRFSGGVTSRETGVILCPGGWGMQLFALNVSLTEDVGSFDSKLDCWGEDHELMRNGISHGFPWIVHCGVKCEPIGVRYDPGGLNSYIKESGRSDRAARELRCRKLIYSRWPEYVSRPEKRSRVQWQKMMDDYIPGWRERSAIHGGRWQY